MILNRQGNTIAGLETSMSMSEPHPLLIISYEQSISLMLATATKVVKFQSLLSQKR